MRIAPKTANDFLAFAELIKNPEAVKQVAKEIGEQVTALNNANADAAKIREQIDESRTILQKIEDEKAALAEKEEDLADEKLDHQKKVDKFNDEVAEFDRKRDAFDDEQAEQMRLTHKNEDEAERLRVLADELDTKKIELDNALATATAEYENWVRKNDELKRIVA